MADIFQEVDEALQRDKAEKLWKEYGPTMLLAAAVLILSTAVFTGWRTWHHYDHTQETALLLDALKAPDPAAALEQVLPETGGSQRAIAAFIAADQHIGKGEIEKAQALFEDIINDGGVPSSLRDLARLMYVRAGQAEGAPAGDSAALLSILEPLLRKDNSPWVWEARIEAALLCAEGLKDVSRALIYLAPFEDAQGLPPSLKERGLSLAHVYGLRVRQDIAATEQKGS